TVMISKIIPEVRERNRPTPPRKRRTSFVKADITRAMSAAQKSGFQVRSIEIGQDGRIRLYSDEGADKSQSLFDQWEERL
ncbi:MAG: hypothetical protein ACKOVA_06820, partial [Novosphingobium sp.]